MAGTCPTCGRSNDDDARFCQSCGAVIAAEEVTAATGSPQLRTPVMPPPGPGTPPAGSGRPGRGGSPWLIALIAVAAIVVVGVLSLIFMPFGDEKADGGASPTPSASTSAVLLPPPALSRYLACAAGPRADRLATIAPDGAVKPITRFAGGQLRQIAYSPDSEWLACIAGTYERSGLWLADTATGAAREATASASSVVAVDSITWLSPGELLVAGYTETPRATGQNADFLVYDLATETFQPLLDDGGVPLRGVSVSSSRDGSAVAFVTYTGVKYDQYGMITAKERLEVLDRGSGALTELGTNKALFDVNARAFDEPVISPSGDAIIFRRAGSDVGTSYTVIGTDGTTLMPAKEALMPAGYAWDPSGTKVVFTGQSIKSAAGNGPTIFWQFDTESGGAPKVLARYRNTYVQGLSWSPDGSTIAWADYDQKKQWRTGNVYLMSADGGDSTALVKGALSPVWAPGSAQTLQSSPNPEQ